jgi:predicted CXXCH cytochrome family protein
MRRMKKSPLWQHGVIVLLICGVAVFGRTDDAGAPVSATDAHGGIDCALCHSLVASLEENFAVASPTQHCRSCHDVQAESPGGSAAAFHEDGNRSCGDCHRFHEPGMIEVQGSVFAPARSAGPESCVACHDGGGSTAMLSEGHQLAAAMYHSNDPVLTGLNASESCLLCHAEGVSARVASLETIDVPRFSRHRMHPVGEVKRQNEFRNGVKVRRVFDPQIRLHDNRIECYTCHQLASGTKNRLIDLGSPQALCLACHEFD